MYEVFAIYASFSGKASEPNARLIWFTQTLDDAQFHVDILKDKSKQWSDYDIRKITLIDALNLTLNHGGTFEALF